MYVICVVASKSPYLNDRLNRTKMVATGTAIEADSFDVFTSKKIRHQKKGKANNAIVIGVAKAPIFQPKLFNT